MWRSGLLGGSLALACLSTLIASSATASPSRFHLTVANELVDRLSASGDGSIALEISTSSVELASDDAAAILANPAAFRAGVAGLDVLIFPGVTAVTHAAGRAPMEQCQELLAAATTAEQRAFALGCRVHGGVDIVSRHAANYLAGETETFHPISASRGESFDNLARHLVFEAMLENAIYTLEPERLGASALAHQFPADLLQARYFDTTSPVWQTFGADALDVFDAARAATPSATLTELIDTSGFGLEENFILAPIYAAEIETHRESLRTWLQDEVADMQDWSSIRGSELLVTPGTDGVLGTQDDETDCSSGCALLFSQYAGYTRLLAPRKDAGGNDLPPMFEGLTTKLDERFRELLPAIVDSIEGLSARLNQEVSAPGSAFDLDASELPGLFSPMTDWSAGVSTMDFGLVIASVSPDWLMDYEDHLQNFGINADAAAMIETVYSELIADTQDAIDMRLIQAALVYWDVLLDEYEADATTVEAEYEAELDASTPLAATDHAVDTLLQSGLFAHSLNLAAAALAEPDVLRSDDALSEFVPSFSASYMTSWTQAEQCSYLGDELFPLGPGVKGLLSVYTDQALVSEVDDNSAVECHAGSLSAFGTPSSSSCAFVTLDELLDTPQGSLSTAYPPSYAASAPTCGDLSVPGLPEPPEPSGAGGGEGDGGEPSTSSGAGGDGGNDASASGGSGASSSGGSDDGSGGSDDGSGGEASGGATSGGASAKSSEEDSGCSCRTRPRASGTLASMLTLGLLAFGRARSRRRATR